MKEAPIASGEGSSIRITHRSERSLYTQLIHLICRPLRNILGRPKEQHPEGSIKLKPHKIILRTCTVSERNVCGIYIYDIFPRRTPKDEAKKRIYYFCGGGWQSPPSSQHWQLCAKLARQMPDTAISMVSYPLAPNNAAPQSIPKLMELYRALMQAADEAGDKVILSGDSSGGNLVLCLVLEALRQDAENAENAGVVSLKPGHVPHPAAVMAICPSTDLTRSNPDIEKLKKVDPILTPDFIKSTAKAWQGDWDPTDRRLSPVNADFSLLANSDIKVHGVTGGYDILGPDGIIFRDKCAKAGVRGEWLHWEKQMHCFILTWPYGVPEGRQGTGWIIDILRKE
ncbi:alpha/beta-hydrolase [Corynespora cassiicola Philippines]|uniref:Alpha/beta-hydrolase n=1 Tax=Corynespora cassiicola Philippines TaxID=1448308 RepID=A0A2T2PCI8_CORCC|nr:alpha/beta-hydrolase [Corynespora cassiicola Philippines]